MDPDDIDWGHALGLAPTDAVAYLRSLGVEVASGWQDALEVARRRAFTVTGMASEALLETTRRLVETMVSTGQTRREAAESLEAALRRAGWWGEGAGTPWRVRTILSTNAGVAYGAGRYRRQIDNAVARPYWQYTAVLDGVTRPSHRRLNGTVFVADSPAWRAIYPPNGFNCRCRVRALTAEQVEEQGLAPVTAERIETEHLAGRDADGEPAEVPMSRVEWRDADGRERSFTPDAGWDRNPALDL